VAKLKLFIGALFLATVYWGCSAGNTGYFEIPTEFRFPEKRLEFAKNYYPYIAGKKIFIDPGHGGKERGNKGFESFEAEANLNLKVSLYLRDYLTESGAVVFMSRTKDTTVDLKLRSIMADSSGADIFISIHHNAPGSAEDTWTDYTSTYYHSRPNNYNYEPCEHDIARYVQRDLAYAVRNSGGLGSFDGTYSDYAIYPGEGFSVLRETKIPSVLVECTFSTDHFEADRLKEDEFNRIEAWGIFKGLCKYFKAGIPEIIPIDNKDTLTASDLNFNYLLKDSSGIDFHSIKVQFDSTGASEIAYDDSTGLLSVGISGAEPGEHILNIIVANKNGNHSFPYLKEVFVLPNE
jgi:N-acetylmuramoyl-L-alanine amidase